MFGKLSADCVRCRRDPSLRAEMGCDADAPMPVWRSGCPCGGVPDCKVCEGDKVRRWYRCPGSMLRGRPDVYGAVNAWVQYETRNVLPVSGGWLDQTASFVEVCEVMDRERAYWDEQHEERASRQRREAEVRARAKGAR